MRFNLGPSRFRLFKRMIAAIDEGDYQQEAVSIRDSTQMGAASLDTRDVRHRAHMQTGAV